MTDHPRTEAAAETALAAAIALVARGQSPDADVAGLLELAAGTVHASLGGVFLWDGDRDGLALAASFGFGDDPAALARQITADPEHPIARAAHAQTAVTDASINGPGGVAASVAAWPLRVAHDGVEMPIGSLAIGGSGSWSRGPSDLAFLAAVADLIAIAVDRARLTALATERSDWSERLAHTDALTGLANARTLRRVLELEVARANRQGTELSVVLFDVDDLARANDEVGPAAGDDLLREVAAVVAESVRLVDTVGRWGGDEFLVVAPGAAGATVARRVLDALSARPVATPAACSVSAGVARLPVDGTDADELIAAAEAALRTAKGTGPGAMAEAGAA